MIKKFFIISAFFLSLFFIDNVKASDYDDFSSFYTNIEEFIVGYSGNRYNVTYEDLQIIEDYLDKMNYYYIIKLHKHLNNDYYSFYVYLYTESNKPTYIKQSSSYSYTTNKNSSYTFYFPYGASPLSSTRDTFETNVLNAMQNNTFTGINEQTGGTTNVMRGSLSTGLEKCVIYSTNIEGLILDSNATLPIKINEDTYIYPGDEIITYKDLNGLFTPNYNIKSVFSTNNLTNNLHNDVVDLYFSEENESIIITGDAYFKLDFVPKNNDIISDVFIDSIDLYGSNDSSNDTDTFVPVSITGVGISDLKYNYEDNHYIVTGKININANACNYKNYLLRIKFSSSQNTVISTYDTFDNSKWYMPQDFLQDYILYTFPHNVNTMYISGGDTGNIRLYTDKTFTNINREDLILYRYDYLNNIFINSISYKNDISNLSDIVYYNSYIDYENNTILAFTRDISTVNDNVYVWVPSNYTVSFSPPMSQNCVTQSNGLEICEPWYIDNTNNIILNTPSGNINISVDNVNNNSTNISNGYNKYDENESFYDYWLNPIKYIFNIISNFFNGLTGIMKSFYIVIFLLILVLIAIRFIL